MTGKNDKVFNLIPTGGIKPEGWLLKQLERMNTLQKRLGLLPGLLKNGEWEEGEALPRYVRGLVLLGGALDDKALKEKATTFVNLIMSGANEGGDFGPLGIRSITPRTEAIKTLLTYYEQCGDVKVLHFLKKFFKNQYNTYSVTHHYFDSRARLLEEIPAIEAVYRETDLEWLKDLGEKLRESSSDWFRLSAKFPYKKRSSEYASQKSFRRVRKIVESYDKIGGEFEKKKPYNEEFADSQWKKKAHRVAVETNGTNIAKAIKYAVVYGRFMGDDDLKYLSLKLLAALIKYHGTPVGMFTCDTGLAGLNPVRGIDTEAAVETVESLIDVIAATGDFAAADLLEQIMFNLIPAVCLENVSAVQDFMSVNQEEALDSRRYPNSYFDAGNDFLTKKLSRGAVAVLSAYPLFMKAICLTRSAEMNFMTYAPCVIDTVVNGARIVLKEETGYPFRNSVIFNVEYAEGEPEVKINFRVPGGTVMQLISGGQVVAEGTGSISVKCVLRTGSTFMLKMDIPLRAVENRNNTVSLMKGNVLMALKMPYKFESGADRRTINVKFIKKWNLAPVLSKKPYLGYRKLYDVERTEVNEIGETPYDFEKPPFELFIRAKNVLNWDYDVNGFIQIPRRPLYSEESLERVFVPFGCEPLHIAEFPRCFK